MAYDDSPLIDDNAKRSEESVLRVLSVLSLRNGFSCRPENPDYGVDLNVELLENGQQASSQLFAVQIKSAVKLKTVTKDQQQYFAFPFETSRLRYLYRRQPVGGGLLVLYDEHTQQCYYDYAGALLQRLEVADPEGNWRTQHKATVYLSTAQVLTDAAAASIHATISAAFQRMEMLLQDRGAEVDLPLFRQPPAGNTDILDLSNVQQLAQQLERYGGALFSQREMPQLLDLLGRLPTPIIGASATLSFLAAITHAQVGDYVEGNYFMAKCRPHRRELDAESNLILDLTQVRLDFLQGDVELPTYAARLTELAAKSTSELNRLTLQLNALFFEMAGSPTTALQAKEEEFVGRIQTLFTAIETSALTREEQLLLSVYHSESLQLLGSRLLDSAATAGRLRRLSGGPIYSPEELVVLQVGTGRQQAATGYVSLAYNYAVAHQHKHLRATAAYYLSRYVLNSVFEAMLLRVNDPPALTPNRKQWFITHWDLAGEAYNLFQELSLWKDAHQALSTLVELQQVYQLTYHEPLGTMTLAESTEQLRHLEERFNLPAFHSLVAQAHAELLATLRPATPLAERVNQHGGIAAYTQSIMRDSELPEERLLNLQAEIEAFLLFEATCHNKHLRLRTLLAPVAEAAYAQPSSYFLHDNSTGYATPPNLNIKELLATHKYLLQNEEHK
jgi:hypothetical protein